MDQSPEMIPWSIWAVSELQEHALVSYGDRNLLASGRDFTNMNQQSYFKLIDA